jgi:uncharacterized protein (TIGR04255 family)
MVEPSAKLFPLTPRVIYSNAPLIEVICQLRFPPLLAIESRSPVDFQERIREQFPLLEKAPSLASGLPREVAQLVQGQIGPSDYQFLTEDRASFVTLASDSIAFSTTKYTRWEDFRGQLRIALTALNEIYRPSFFSRIGLRYRDAIDRIQIGLPDTPWSKLLRKEMLGELAEPQFEANLEGVANRTLRLRMPNGTGSVLMRHGLGTLHERLNVCYMIDLDFFTEQRTEVANAESTLNHFNSMAGRAFRWCITDTLRDALGPNELPVAKP